LEDKFVAITTAGKWGGADKMGSIFKASIQGVTPEKKKRKYPSCAAWFDDQDCGKCDKKHPTWAHDDPEGYCSGRLKRPSNNREPRTFKLRFSADTKKKIQDRRSTISLLRLRRRLMRLRWNSMPIWPTLKDLTNLVPWRKMLKKNLWMKVMGVSVLLL
jgi:hypothetical protein